MLAKLRCLLAIISGSLATMDLTLNRAKVNEMGYITLQALVAQVAIQPNHLIFNINALLDGF